MKYLTITKDNWKGHQVWISGYSSKGGPKNQMRAASLKVGPFSKCQKNHDIENFSDPDPVLPDTAPRAGSRPKSRNIYKITLFYNFIFSLFGWSRKYIFMIPG